MGNQNRPTDTPDNGYLDDLPQKTAVKRFFDACLRWQDDQGNNDLLNRMKDAATPAMKEASEGKQFTIVINIYGWLEICIPELLKASPYFHVQYLKALRKTQEPKKTISEGEIIFGEFKENIPRLQADTEKRLRGLQDTLQDSPDDEDIQERVREETREVFRKWIYFFTQTKNILEEILYASYLAQGRETIPDLERWTRNFSVLENWFAKIIEPLRREQEIGSLVALNELDSELRMWQLRLESRMWFFATTPEERRLKAIGLEGSCETFGEHLGKIMNPKHPSNQADEISRTLAPALNGNIKMRLVKLQLERILAMIYCRAYEYGGPTGKEETLAQKEGYLEMSDEALSIISLEQSPQARAWVQKGVDKCFEVMEIGDELEKQSLSEDVRDELEEQLLGTTMRLNENLPKLGRFEEGYAWFQEAVRRAKTRGSVKDEANAMNNFAWQNLFVLGKKPQEASNAEGIQKALGLPDAKPQTFLEAGLRFALEAKEILQDKDSGATQCANETIVEIYLALLELPDIAEETKREWVIQAWDILFILFQGETRPNFNLDMLARCVAYGAELNEEFKPEHLGIAAETYRDGYQFIMLDMHDKKTHTDMYPPSYILGLEEKEARVRAFITSYLKKESSAAATTSVSPPKFE